MGDRFYTYPSYRFDDQQVKDIFTGWDGLSGYHGLQVTKCASLLVGISVLDVGCGMCHLLEALKLNGYTGSYIGLDIEPRVLKLARERYPQLDILEKSAYDLSGLGMFDTVFAIGLYDDPPTVKKSMEEMMNHTNHAIVITYRTDTPDVIPPTLIDSGWENETYPHDIDSRLVVMRRLRI
jgi:SAM-dependent methyltransferase